MKYLLIFTILTLFISCNPNYNTYCEFDLTKTDYVLIELNSGKFEINNKEGNYIVSFRDQISSDTCYLKGIAYRYWMNQPK